MPPAFRCRDTITPKGPSQPATFLFRVTFGAKRKLIHHTVTVTDGTFLFFISILFLPSRVVSMGDYAVEDFG